MNEAERIENLVKRLEKVTDDFISTFPERRNRQLSRSSRYIHRVKDYLNDVKNKVIDGEITPSFETTLDKIESVIELTKNGSIKTLTGAPVYGKDTASLMKNIAKDIKEEQKAVKREAKNKYRDLPLTYDQSLLDEIDSTIGEMDRTEDQIQKANEIENAINLDFMANKTALDLKNEYKELEDTINRVQLEIDLIKADDSLDEKQKQARIRPKEKELNELKVRRQNLKEDKNISSTIDQVRKTQSSINRIGLEIELIEKDTSLNDEQKVARIAPKEEELYRLKDKLRRLRGILAKQQESKNVKYSLLDIPKEEIIRNSKGNLQKILDDIEELTKERDALEKELPLLKEDSDVSDSLVFDETIRRAIKEKEERLDTLNKLITLKRATYHKNYMLELDEIRNNAKNKLHAIDAEINLLSQDTIIPEVLVRNLVARNPKHEIKLINFDTIAADTDINNLDLPLGFYISGNRITNKDTAIGDLYLNMKVVKLIKKEKKLVIDDELLNSVSAEKEKMIVDTETIVPEEHLNKFDEEGKLITESDYNSASNEAEEEPAEEKEDTVIAVSSIEQVKRNKAKTFNEINQIKGNLNKHKEEIKELKSTIRKTKDKKEKAKLKSKLAALEKKYKEKDAKLLETKKIKEKAIDNYDNTIARYEGVKAIVRELRKYVESMDSEIDYDYCLAKQQEIIKLRGENNKYLPNNVLLEIANELDCEKERLDDETIKGVVEILAEGPPRPDKKGKITSKQAVAAVLGVALLGGGIYGVVKTKQSIDKNAANNAELSNTKLEQKEEDTKKEEKNDKEKTIKEQDLFVPEVTAEPVNEQKNKKVETQSSKTNTKETPKEEITDAGTKADPVHEGTTFEPVVDKSSGISDGGTRADENVEGEDITDTSKYNGEVTDAGTTEDPMYSDIGEPIIEENTEEELPDDDTVIDEEEAPDIGPAIEEKEQSEEAPKIDPVTEETTTEESPNEEEEVVNVEDVPAEETTTPEEPQEEPLVETEEPTIDNEPIPLSQEQIDAFDEEDVVEAFVNKGTTKGGINLDNISDADKKALIDRSLEISAENYDIPSGQPAPWESNVLDVYFDEELYNLDSKTM